MEVQYLRNGTETAVWTNCGGKYIAYNGKDYCEVLEEWRNNCLVDSGGDGDGDWDGDRDGDTDIKRNPLKEARYVPGSTFAYVMLCLHCEERARIVTLRTVKLYQFHTFYWACKVMSSRWTGNGTMSGCLHFSRDSSSPMVPCLLMWMLLRIDAHVTLLNNGKWVTL